MSKHSSDLACKLMHTIDDWSVGNPDATVLRTLAALEEVRHVLTEGFLKHGPIVHGGEPPRVATKPDRPCELHERALPLILGALSKLEQLQLAQKRVEDYVLKIVAEHPGLPYVKLINDGLAYRGDQPRKLHGFEIEIVEKLPDRMSWAIVKREEK